MPSSPLSATLTAEEIKNKKEIENLMTSQTPVAIFFFWKECGHCKAMEPVWDELASEMPNMKFVKVEADNIPQEMKDTGEYGSFPKFVVVKNGKAVPTTQQGEMPKEVLKKTLTGGKRRVKTLGRRASRRHRSRLLTRRGLKRRH
jgi:thiol-disulfide isomerase/thioredoxin